MRTVSTLLTLALLAGACSGESDEPAATTSPPPPPTATVATTTAVPSTPSSTTTSTLLVTTTSAPEASAPVEFETWDARENGYSILLPVGWEVLGEVDAGTKSQVIGISGLEATRERLANSMLLAVDPQSEGSGLFVAPIPPGSATGASDDYEELAALDETGLRALEGLLAGGTDDPGPTARLAQTAQGHLALVISLQQFGINFELITVTPADGVAWSLVATFDGAAYAPEVVEAIVDSFTVTGVPVLVDPGPPDEELVALAAGAPRFEGALLPPYITGADPDVGLGASAPTVSGTDFDDRPTGIVHDGTPKAIVFMAHWCPHCQNEVPAVQAWLEETGGVDGVEIITVITAYAPSRGNWSPRDWLESEGWTPDVIRDDATGSIHTAYGAGGFPYWVFLDGEGTVALRWAGAIEVVNLEMIFEAMAAG